MPKKTGPNKTGPKETRPTETGPKKTVRSQGARAEPGASRAPGRETASGTGPHLGSIPSGPRTVAASYFKNACLQLIEEVHQTREEIIVTRYGRPVARLVALDAETPALFGHLAGSVTLHGDLVAPIDEGWNAAE
jgi:prevent-host-death family protein